MSASFAYDGALTCALNVTDIDKSIGFYREVLGFELLYKVDDIGWCEMQTEIGKVTVGLSQVEQVPTDGGATLTFGVADIDDAREQVEAKDVRFDGPTRTIPGMVKLATFYDPDGNALMFAQGLAEE